MAATVDTFSLVSEGAANLSHPMTASLASIAVLHNRGSDESVACKKAIAYMYDLCDFHTSNTHQYRKLVASLDFRRTWSGGQALLRRGLLDIGLKLQGIVQIRKSL